ncbi:MAG: hypothetical protein LAP87_10100 [Acidobacteriia bacterium]|nr:hypothetical protein [Terriglobia bacterium]
MRASSSFGRVVLTLILSGCALGQPYTISTFAGGGLPVNIPATSASLGGVGGVAADHSGNLFIVSGLNVVLRLDAASKVLTLLAGNGTAGFSGDNGPAINAQFAGPPEGIAVDSAGNVYLADSGNNRIRKVSNGVITTVAGTGASGFAGDGGAAPSAILNFPIGLSFDSAGNLYFSDSRNRRVRKISDGVITTVAGTGTFGFDEEGGPAIAAQLSAPGVTTVDSAGNLYFVDSASAANVGTSSIILKVSNGVLTRIPVGLNGGSRTSFDLAGDTAGNIYIADSAFRGVLKLSNGLITAVAGNGTAGFRGDGGPATLAQLSDSLAIAVDPAGNLYIADSGNNRIREVSAGVITTVAGNGTVNFGGDSGPAASAQLNSPTGVAVDAAGSVYIADSQNNRVRKVSGGVIATVAEVSGKDIAVDGAGNLYIADPAGNVVRKVSNGVITTVAGTGTSGFRGDGGAATEAQLRIPSGVAVDALGSLYIADLGNVRIRKVSGGVISTVAGNGKFGFAGDGGAATDAQLRIPSGVAVDSAGNLYIADQFNGRIRKVSNGVISTVVAGLTSPSKIALNAAGSLYITDANRIRKVTNGAIETVAGSGVAGFSGDGGEATSARLNQPAGIAVDAAGNVYVADTGNNRIRVLTPGVPPPVLAINAGSVVNAASFVPGVPLVPGSIASVFGSFLESSLTTAAGTPLPDNLAGLSVEFGNGQRAPLFAVTGGQVNFQVPWELAGPLQTTLSATVNGQASAGQFMNLAPFAPGIFTLNAQGTGQGAILDNATGRLVDASNPAIAGSTVIQIYCTGLGAVTNQPPSGSPALSDPLSRTTTTPEVAIGFVGFVAAFGIGIPAPVLFSGLAPGFVGVYQVNVLVPAALTSNAGGQVFPVDVFMTIGGAGSNVASIVVK